MLVRLMHHYFKRATRSPVYSRAIIQRNNLGWLEGMLTIHPKKFVDTCISINAADNITAYNLILVMHHL